MSATTQYGITETGFVKKPFLVILQENIEEAKKLFGDNIDLRPTSTIYKFIQLRSLEDSLQWDLAEQFWYSMFITTATGESLDRLGEDRGLTRQPPQKATGEVTFVGVNYALIQIDTIVATFSLTEYGIVKFKTLESRYIGQIDDEELTGTGTGPFTLANIPANPVIRCDWFDSSETVTTKLEETGNPTPSAGEFYVDYGTGEITVGTALDTGDKLYVDYVDSTETTAQIQIEALEFGTTGNVPSNTIINIIGAIAGVTSVNNAQATDYGRDIESDNSFRQRLLDQPRTVFGPDRIKSEVENVDGVKSAYIVEGVKRERRVETGQGPFTLLRAPENPIREVMVWQQSGSAWIELTEATSYGTMGPYQFFCDYGGVTYNEDDLYIGTLGGTGLTGDDILEVLYIDKEIGSAIFLVLVDPLVSPLDPEVEREIAAALDNIRPTGIAYSITEITKIDIEIDVDLELEVGYSLDPIAQEIDKQFRLYIDGPSSSEEAAESEYTGLGIGSELIRNEIIRIIMSVDGVLDFSSLTIKKDTVPQGGNIQFGTEESPDYKGGNITV